MPWSSAAINATIAASTAANKPMFLGENHVRNATIEWRTGGSFAAGADDTNAASPAKRLRDGLYLPTIPTADTAATHYILMSWATAIEFDTLAIMGIGARGGVASLVEIADDNAFATNLQTVWDFNAESTYRYAKALALKYSGVQYLRIKLAKPTGTHLAEEVFIGERHQLNYGQVGNYNPNAIGSDIEESVTRGGVRTRYVQASGYFEQSEEFQIENATETVTQFWEDIGRGAKSFCYWQNPGTAINAFRLMMPSAEKLPLDFDGPTMRRWMNEATEQGPKYLLDYP